VAVTLTELKQKLANYYDEISLLELLNITSEELVERFYDKIEDRYDELVEEFPDDEEE